MRAPAYRGDHFVEDQYFASYIITLYQNLDDSSTQLLSNLSIFSKSPKLLYSYRYEHYYFFFFLAIFIASLLVSLNTFSASALS